MFQNVVALKRNPYFDSIEGGFLVEIFFPSIRIDLGGNNFFFKSNRIEIDLRDLRREKAANAGAAVRGKDSSFRPARIV